MDVGLKKLSFGAPLSTCVSELSEDDDDGLALSGVTEDDTFEIPLKTSFFRNSNFSELNDDLESLRSPPSNSDTSKRVRFEANSNDNDAGHIAKSGSAVSSSETIKGRKNVEDLLQYANQVNDYVAQNLEKINTFRTDLLNDGLPHKPSSDMATQATNLSASMSNFELSDNDEDPEGNNEGIPFHSLDGDQHSSSLNKNEAALLDTLPTTIRTGTLDSESERYFGYGTENNSSQDLANVETNDHTLENSPVLRASTLDTDIISQELRENIKKLVVSSPQKIERSSFQDDTNDSRSSLIISEIDSPDEMPDISPDKAIELFTDTINFILQLSQKQANQSQENHSHDSHNDCNDLYDSNEYSNFAMKSAPTLSYKQLILRIQSKCMFGPIVFLTASFLIQTLLLTREFPKGPIILRHQLSANEAHRLVIASVRIATKLLEDCVHSHQYFCKVCGVSKRLLTRLEASLIICLKNDALIITIKKMTASIQVSDELRQQGSD